MSEETKSNTPSKDHKFFVYEPDGDVFTYFSNEKERDNFARDLIHLYLSDGWDEDVESIITGIITAEVKKKNVRYRKDQNIDKDGYDNDGS